MVKRLKADYMLAVWPRRDIVLPGFSLGCRSPMSLLMSEATLPFTVRDAGIDIVNRRHVVVVDDRLHIAP